MASLMSVCRIAACLLGLAVLPSPSEASASASHVSPIAHTAQLLDYVWVLVAAGLVMLMQIGFLHAVTLFQTILSQKYCRPKDTVIG